MAAVYRTVVYARDLPGPHRREGSFTPTARPAPFGTAITEEAWECRPSLILAKVLCVGLSFLGYHLFVAADRRLGKGTLWQALWGSK